MQNNQVAETVSQSSPCPLGVDQSTQTEKPYPEPIDDYINKIKRILLEEQRTMKDSLIQVFKIFYERTGRATDSRVERLVNRMEEFSRQCVELITGNRDDEVINENEENSDIVSHDESYSNEGMDYSEVTSENEEDADSVSNDENYNDGYNSHSEDNEDDISEEDTRFRGLF